MSILFTKGVGIFFNLAIDLFSAIATYAAATDMNWSSFYRQRAGIITVRSQYLGETSAISTWSLLSVGFVALDVFVHFLIIEDVLENVWEGLAFLLCILGGVFVIIGGYIVYKE